MFFFFSRLDMSGGWVEMGRTEKIVDSLNPRWQTKFLLDYKFEEKQMLRFAIFDIDSQFQQKMDDHDKLGHIDCSLGEVSQIRHSILQLYSKILLRWWPFKAKDLYGI